MSRALIAALGKLRKSHGGSMAGSALTASQRQALDTFARRTRCVSCQPRGRGVVYSVSNPDLLLQHWHRLCPTAEADISQDMPTRAANIARRRNSKSARHQHSCYYLLLKAIDDRASWKNEQGGSLAVADSTARHGVAALAIASHDSWQSQAPLWLVENQALFDRLDWLPTGSSGSIAYYGGQLNNLLLNWLAARPRASQIILFPDYDSVGLMNYARLRERVACHFWLMPHWQERLQRFGNADLWQATRKDFRAAAERILHLTPPAPLRELLNVMQTAGLALEQEAVWLE